MTTLLFGGGGSKTKTPIYTGIQIQTSAYNLPIPFGWGKNRISFNALWYNDFQKHKQSGGKGGGKGSGGYTYTAAVILGLGEGIISSIPNVYINQNTVTTLAKLNLSLVTGTALQTPESFITTKYPAQALSYANTAYLFSPKLDLGSSATIPSMGFEAVMNLSGSMPGTPSANMADIIPDFLTNSRYGCGLSMTNIDATSNTFFKSYTQAQGLFFSPILNNQEIASETIDRWAQLSNSWIFWSGNVIKFVPLGDEPLAANSATYTPVTTIQYDLTVDDFVDSGDGVPIRIQRIDPADAYNRTIVTINDATLQYNSNPIEYKDQTLVDRYGRRDNGTIQASEITDAGIGLIAATLIGKRAAYLRNEYDFTLINRFVRLEPGDLVTLTHPFISVLNKLPVRVKTIEEDDQGNLAVIAEEYPGTIGIFRSSTQQAPSNVPIDMLVDPGDVNPPCIFEPNSNLASPAQIWTSVSGGPNWGGADVYISLDGTTYSKIGTINNAAKQGLLTATLASHADPDTTNTLSVDLTSSQGILAPVTHADADAFRTLSYISAAPIAGVVPATGELVAYGTVTPTGTYSNNLTYLRRALYGTAAASHATGQVFTLLDLTGANGSMLRYPLPPQYVGATIHIKFVSFNIFGFGYQDISTVTDYTYTTTGNGFGGGTGGGTPPSGFPTTPTGLAVSTGTGANTLSWNPNPSTDNVLGYLIYRANGTGALFGSATQIGQAGAGATSYIDSSAVAGQPYTYFIAAGNLVGFSFPTAGVSTTSAGSVSGSLRLSGGTPGRAPASSEELFNPPMATGDVIPITSGAPTKAFIQCEVAPTNNWTITFKKNGTTVGTATINAAATTGSFSGFSGSSLAFSDADFFIGTCPSTVDPTISGVGYAIFGTRTV